MKEDAATAATFPERKRNALLVAAFTKTGYYTEHGNNQGGIRTIAAAAHTPHIWREVNKWTQLFDATVIFMHMDLSAASERIVRTHLNHRQPLLPTTGTVLTSAQR